MKSISLHLIYSCPFIRLWMTKPPPSVRQILGYPMAGDEDGTKRYSGVVDSPWKFVL
jgi:hypothetical protein